MDDIYYRLYRISSGEIEIVCMQWFDEFDYDETQFLTDEKFETEEEAALKLAWYRQVFLEDWAARFRDVQPCT